MSIESIEAPLPGKVLKVMAQVGAKVEEGDDLCSIESMKMENPIVATVSGTVTEIKVTAGSMVKAGDPIATIEY